MNLSQFLSRQRTLNASCQQEAHQWQEQGKVEKMITAQTTGRVYFQSTYWPACLASSNGRTLVLPDTLVKVVGRQGITLIVVPTSLVASASPFPLHAQEIA